MPDKDFLFDFAETMLTMIVPWNSVLSPTSGTKDPRLLPEQMDAELFGLFVSLWLAHERDGKMIVHVEEVITFVEGSSSNARTYLSKLVGYGYLLFYKGKDAQVFLKPGQDGRKTYYRLHPDISERITAHLTRTREHFKTLLAE
ncbi:MAG: hypothetical protein ACPGOV_00450 [Magnetovibrionaceae bacterium]